jgi:Fe2+ or Zn2+ uptake regulation protein
VTPDRLAVFRALQANDAPVGIADLIEQTAPHGINQATIYRTLERFVALSIAHMVLLPHGVVGYELMPPFSPHHHHLSCARCGKVIDFYNSQMDRVIQRVAENEGFTVRSHSVEIYGLCAQCAAKEAAPAPDSPPPAQ